MKKLLLLIPVLMIAGIFFYACQDTNIVEPQTNTTVNKLVDGYDIVLIGGAPVNNGDGTYTWTWSVTNTNPGNGDNGTTQDLSHWDLVPGACLVIDDIESASYSANGTDWTLFNPQPKIESDNSIYNTCEIETGPVLKFDEGTEG